MASALHKERQRKMHIFMFFDFAKKNLYGSSGSCIIQVVWWDKRKVHNPKFSLSSPPLKLHFCSQPNKQTAVLNCPTSKFKHSPKYHKAWDYIFNLAFQAPDREERPRPRFGGRVDFDPNYSQTWKSVKHSTVFLAQSLL